MSIFPNVCVSIWQVSSVDYFLWIWNISNRWLCYHLLNIIRCVLAGQNQIIDVLSSQYETFALFVFPCFLCAFFFSLWVSSYHPWQFGIRNFSLSYLSFGCHVVPSRCTDVAILHIAWHYFWSAWINTIALKLQLLAVAQVQEYGLCHFMGLLSDHFGFSCQLMIGDRERNKQNCNGKARPGRIRSCDNEGLFCFDR